MKIKSINIFTILIFFTLFNNIIFSQNENKMPLGNEIGIQTNSKFNIYLKGGIIYHSPGAGLLALGDYQYKLETQNFISSLFLSYQLDEKQFIDFGISFVSADNIARNIYSTVNWNFKIYPISLSYKYVTKNHLSKLRPFVAVGFNYIINRVNITVTGNSDRNNSGKLNTSGYGFELSTGLFYSLNNKINLSSEIKLNYRDEYAFADYNIGQSSLSLQLLIGVGYSL